ncbi:MAG: hypothetical protein M2R45_00583 [Verrucomicrobia subdivision 3 bacterium]|nr:hypothetical protein [Limisphaerales bacterium]MCS1413539.1 hypothetical protein [Limisphaerales bacterium]
MLWSGLTVLLADYLQTAVFRCLRWSAGLGWFIILTQIRLTHQQLHWLLNGIFLGGLMVRRPASTNPGSIGKKFRKRVLPRLLPSPIPLHRSEQSRRDMVALLLEYGAGPNLKDAFSGHALHRTSLADQLDVASLLLEQGIDPLFPTGLGTNALIHLVSYSDYRRIRWRIGLSSRNGCSVGQWLRDAKTVTLQEHTFPASSTSSGPGKPQIEQQAITATILAYRTKPVASHSSPAYPATLEQRVRRLVASD